LACKLKVSLQKAAGDSLKGDSVASIVEPGKLSPAARQALVSAITGR